MKHLLLLSLIIYSTVDVYSQPSVGKVFIGGDLGFSFVTDKTGSIKNSTTYNITALPKVGYFIGNKWAIGGILGLDSHTTIYPAGSLYAQKYKVTDNTFEGGIFNRFYLISGTGGLFTETSFLIGIAQSKTKLGDQTSKGSSISVSGLESIGVYYYLTPKIAIEASYGWFGYTDVGWFDVYGSKHLTETLGFNFSASNLSFGMIITL
jgi:hypothetical protein